MASFNLDRIIKSKQILNTELQNGNQISYTQSWRVLKKVENQVFNNEAKFFKKISLFLKNLSQVNPQAYWRLKT